MKEVFLKKLILKNFKKIQDLTVEFTDKNTFICGGNGTGKTTLAKAACGIIKKQTGKVKLNGKKLSVRECLKESYFVMQDVDYQLFTESVHDEMVLGRKLSEELEEKIEKSLEKLNLKAVTEQHPMSCLLYTSRCV